MAKQFTITATVTVEELPVNRGPVLDEQPPTTAKFLIGQPATIPFGRGHDPDGDPLTTGLNAAIAGFSAALQGDQILLSWDGKGQAGTYQVQAFLDDGKG